MSLTEKSKDLNTRIEPRAPGVITESGLLKLADGTLMARHATESGAREGADMDAKMATADAQLAELEAMRAAQAQTPKAKRARKKAEVQQQPDDVVDVAITVEGFGGIPSQYAQVCPGIGCLLLGLTPRSFIPQQAVLGSDGKPTQVLRVSSVPDRRYMYTGFQVTDKYGTTNLILIQIPDGV